MSFVRNISNVGGNKNISNETKPLVIKAVTYLKGSVSVPGDKSIAHRAVILSSLSNGKTIIDNFPFNKDCLATVEVFRQLGIKIKIKGNKVVVYGKGLHGLEKPDRPFFINESGTTYRLLLGVLSGQDFEVKLRAGKALAKRPMRRVTLPLRMMGAFLRSRLKGQRSKIEEYPPIRVRGGKLKGINYTLPVSSAQVKSAILLAGLYAAGKTVITEPTKTRDHTERMLRLFKVNIKIDGRKISLASPKKLTSPKNIYVPADMSSASFFMVAALIVADSQVILKKVSLNPSRMGIIRVLKRMNADIKINNSKYTKFNERYEPFGDIIVRSSRLKAAVIKDDEIASLIDEIPILAVAACFARGDTYFKGIQELRVKETDRVKSIQDNLSHMGVDIKVRKRGKKEDIIIRGKGHLEKSNLLKSYGDHRTAMSFVVASLAARGRSRIDDVSCINKSFPEFIKTLSKIAPFGLTG